MKCVSAYASIFSRRFRVRLQALQEAYRNQREQTVLYAGPVVLETFGERPFSPEIREECPRFSRSQQKKISRFRQQSDQLYDKAVIGKERSFTIIAFPVPEITRGYAGGELKASFDEIFHAVIDINTLDYMTYRNVQAGIIAVLDTAEYIHVLGKNGNKTDLMVHLQTPRDPEKETIFENCVADVNIPVGEVFTTPELAGTCGLLHVTSVYLNGLLFEDLAVRFEDGRITDYSCGGFPTEKEGREYIEENILFHHDTLPMGECAIGTNTTASAEAARLGILERLPILIAEKTGPHFAVGDTCYSHEEENRIFNPDGKEIFAKENDYSLMRDTDPDKAYFGCHTDITIPYEEVGLLEAVRFDGTSVPVIRDGLFVLPGTDILNEPFQGR
jgi:leucyl aminopeptidase (aminopeptidase T)